MFRFWGYGRLISVFNFVGEINCDFIVGYKTGWVHLLFGQSTQYNLLFINLT